MAEQDIKIVERDGVFYLSGVMNEYADFSPLLPQAAPLRLNMKQVTRLNSIGIRNLLKFLADWGPKPFSYEECPSEFVDQLNMIPALLGVKNHGKVVSLFVPYECLNCDHEEEVLGDLTAYEPSLKNGTPPPAQSCPKCKADMVVLTDSFFVFASY